MCLVKIHKFPRISWKPIICYKVLKVHKGNYMTPCVDYFISRDREVIKGNENFFEGLKDIKICGWGVHAFTNMYNAMNMANYFCMIDQRIGGHVVVKCIIPRFTFYFKGKNNEICSRKMIICLNNEKQ